MGLRHFDAQASITPTFANSACAQTCLRDPPALCVCVCVRHAMDLATLDDIARRMQPYVQQAFADIDRHRRSKWSLPSDIAEEAQQLLEKADEDGLRACAMQLVTIAVTSTAKMGNWSDLTRMMPISGPPVFAANGARRPRAERNHIFTSEDGVMHTPEPDVAGSEKDVTPWTVWPAQVLATVPLQFRKLFRQANALEATAAALDTELVSALAHDLEGSDVPAAQVGAAAATAAATLPVGPDGIAEF
jgi:hypothetical protein